MNTDSHRLFLNFSRIFAYFAGKKIVKFLNLKSLILFIFALLFSFSANAQKIAVLSPDETARSREFSERLTNSLSENFRLSRQFNEQSGIFIGGN